MKLLRICLFASIWSTSKIWNWYIFTSMLKALLNSYSFKHQLSFSILKFLVACVLPLNKFPMDEIRPWKVHIFSFQAIKNMGNQLTWSNFWLKECYSTFFWPIRFVWQLMIPTFHCLRRVCWCTQPAGGFITRVNRVKREVINDSQVSKDNFCQV